DEQCGERRRRDGRSAGGQAEDGDRARASRADESHVQLPRRLRGVRRDGQRRDDPPLDPRVRPASEMAGDWFRAAADLLPVPRGRRALPEQAATPPDRRDEPGGRGGV
ncbi:MAG: hypothetical protein AVDCRST_MAG64-4451, partial [uncultured Phycisphaerae bacterium]